MDKVKESLFAMIQSSIKNSIFLDLFSGSGSLGIEAISNGASMVYFIDNNPYAIKTINENINMLNIIDKSNIILNDYKKALEYFKNNNISFNLIFLDPPYDMEVIESILMFIDENKLLFVS
jgi:16S rRNA (guanine(966)-N(2))-methyltransferase RsmD